MENETMNQNVPVQNIPQQPVMPPVVEQSHTSNAWYLVGAVVVIIAIALWYVYGTRPAPAISDTQADATQTEDIYADLGEALLGSDALDQDASASAAAVGAL